MWCRVSVKIDYVTPVFFAGIPVPKHGQSGQTNFRASERGYKSVFYSLPIVIRLRTKIAQSAHHLGKLSGMWGTVYCVEADSNSISQFY